jgi:hypothetical protein
MAYAQHVSLRLNTCVLGLTKAISEKVKKLEKCVALAKQA